MGKSSRARVLPDNEAKAVTRNLRVSPRKLNDVATIIRGKKVETALADLTFSRRRIAEDVKKTLESAIANAENNHDLDINELIVSEAYVGKKMVMKRFKPRARGSAGAIRKRTSHIFITLTDEFEAPEEKQRSGKPKKRDTIKSLFGEKAKPSAVKEEAPTEEAVEETEAPGDSAE